MAATSFERGSVIRAPDLRRSVIDRKSFDESRSLIAEQASIHVATSAETTGRTTSFLGNLMPAIATTIIEVVNCISVALILRGKWKPTTEHPLLPDMFDPLFRHVMLGFIVTQLATSAFTKFPAAISSAAFENLALLATLRDAVMDKLKDKSSEVQVANFLACIAVSLLLSAVLLAMAAIPQVGKILGKLPDDVRHGVFMAIGIAVFMLGFDSFDLKPMEAETWTDRINLLKWCPAYALGFGLWYVAEHCPSRYLVIGFIAAVVSVMSIMLKSLGMTPTESADGGWVLAEVDPQPITAFFRLTYGSLDKVDFSIIVENIGTILAAAFVGPVMNVSINVLVLNGMLGPIKNLSFPVEFLAQSLGSFLSCITFGFSSYMTVSDTAMMMKAGGRTVQPVLMMVALMCVVCFFPYFLPILAANIPVLLPASLFVYLGIDIVVGCLGEMKETLKPKEQCFAMLTCFVCTYAGLPVGLIGASAACAFQHYAFAATDLQNQDARRPTLGSVQASAREQLSMQEAMRAPEVRSGPGMEVELNAAFVGSA